MFRKAAFLLIVMLLLAPFTTAATFAASGSNCPDGFTLVMHMDHEEHEHQHVGTSADLNGDGYICMSPVTPDNSIHVHIDNNIPRPK